MIYELQKSDFHIKYVDISKFKDHCLGAYVRLDKKL